MRVMTEQASKPLGPTGLLDAVDAQSYGNYDSMPSGACRQLVRLGRLEHRDFTWGFRIYRTSYTKPNSDADFAKAIDNLHAYMRLECFSYSEEEKAFGDLRKPVNGKANQQLWRHLKNDIVQDPERLEGASKTPAKIIELARDWVYSHHPGAKVNATSRHRYHIIVDDEVVEHLLKLPIPATWGSSIPKVYSVKVFDAGFGLPDDGSCDEGDCSDDDDDDMLEGGIEGYEGWFWASARSLMWLWFKEHDAPDEELLLSDRSWNNEKRFVYIRTALDMLPIMR
jgi:hypothetical protein